MLERILQFSIQRRGIVLAFTMAMAALGLVNARHLKVDAVPDITNVQVQVNTEAPGYSPLEVEQRITFPLETAMAGLPGLAHTRSLSRYGLSQITVVFEDDTDLYFARQQVNARIQVAGRSLPEGIVPEPGPIATGLGEIFMYAVEAHPDARTAAGLPYDLAELRAIQDWVIKPQLRHVPGVVEINSIGGFEREFHIQPRPDALRSFGFSLDDLVVAVRVNNANLGAGYVERNGEQVLVRIPGQVRTLADLEAIPIGHRAGRPVPLKAVADVVLGAALRTGAATAGGKETVLGTVFMLVGENSRVVSAALAAKMQVIQSSLPAGVRTRTLYARTRLVNATLDTVRANLTEGALLVVVILLLFLGHLRAALVAALVIPLSMLFTVTGMVERGITGNLMSLGALDFGIIVDGAVIIVENCLRRLGEAQRTLGRVQTLPERLRTVFEGTREVRRATLFGELIITVVYIPILSLTGVEGRMFHPMAQTVILALLGAMLLSVTFVPAALAVVVTGQVAHRENAAVRWAQRGYGPVLRWALARPWPVLALAIVLTGVGGVTAHGMGREFMPSLDEGDVALHALRVPGTSLTQAVQMQKVLEKRVAGLPEVAHVFAKIGTAEIATDPMPPSVADGFVIMKPRDAWPDPRRPKAEVVASLAERLEPLPGNLYEFTQPIEMRFNELLSGVRSDVAVKVFGDDLDVLLDRATAIGAALERIPGAADVRVEPVSGLPVMTVEPNRARLGQFGLSVQAVQRAVQGYIGGADAGMVFHGDRRIPITVRLPDHQRSDAEVLRRLPVPLPTSTLGASSDPRHRFVPVHAVAEVSTRLGPNQITRENGKRRVVVTANIRDRDMGSFVDEARAALRKHVTLPAGVWLAWGGQFEHLETAAARLRLVVPAVLCLVFMLLYSTLGSVRDAWLVFSGVPLALTGGVAALALRGIPLSISAGVGFIALCGVAVLNGLVIVTVITGLRREGETLQSAIETGALSRLRPVLMTAAVASLGFLPMAMATGTGAEVQRPLATVVLGGVLSSTALTLLVLPVLIKLTHPRGEKRDSEESHLSG